MATQKIRIRLKAFDYKLLDQLAEKIVETAKRTGAAMFPGLFHFRLKKISILSYDRLHIDKDSRGTSLKCGLIKG